MYKKTFDRITFNPQIMSGEACLYRERHSD